MTHSRNGHAERLGQELLRLKAAGQLKRGIGTAAIEAAEAAVNEDERLKQIDELAKNLRYLVALKPGGYRDRIREVVEKLKALTGENDADRA